MVEAPGNDRALVSRCPWATGAWLEPYHDVEWGVPVHDDRSHFEFLILEAAQAGLSWLTVLKRREGYRRAFANFDFETVAAFGSDRIDTLLCDSGIIRNRGKIEAAVANARALVAHRAESGSFDDFLWDFVGGSPIVNRWREISQVPAKTALSEKLSKTLRAKGFRFVGPIVCYAHLQATGLINDHLITCHRWAPLSGPGGEP
jgi:DNA-3-methyladenine glycosylase I